MRKRNSGIIKTYTTLNFYAFLSTNQDGSLSKPSHTRLRIPRAPGWIWIQRAALFPSSSIFPQETRSHRRVFPRTLEVSACRLDTLYQGCRSQPRAICSSKFLLPKSMLSDHDGLTKIHANHLGSSIKKQSIKK